MNEKEAREIIQEHKEGKCHECFEGECMDEAKGYLEALEKAKVLVEALIKVKNECAEILEEGGYGHCHCSCSDLETALSQWEKEK